MKKSWKLTQAQRSEICRLKLEGGVPVAEIAERFNISRITVYNICMGFSRMNHEVKAILSDAEYKAILHIAIKNNVTVSMMVRAAIVDAIADEENVQRIGTERRSTSGEGIENCGEIAA